MRRATGFGITARRLIPGPNIASALVQGITGALGPEIRTSFRAPGHFWAISESVIPSGMTR